MGDLSTHFSRIEFSCPCCGYDTVDSELLGFLEKIREHFDRPVQITSGCRCTDHNASVGGSENSQHLVGRAADFVVDGVPPGLVAELCDQLDIRGVGEYPSWVHIDTRTGSVARW